MTQKEIEEWLAYMAKAADVTRETLDAIIKALSTTPQSPPGALNEEPTSESPIEREPYVWRDMKDVPKDQDVILYFSLGTCRVPLVARCEPGYLDPIGLVDWRVTHPIPGEAPTGWLPIVWKD